MEKFDLDGPILKMARFSCHICEKAGDDHSGEFPMCLECARECLTGKRQTACGHALGKKQRARPRRAYEKAAAYAV